ncbi:tetratricopeptide repeat protein [Holosporaceae bacterium 'Namur']|nr:tetratricopeptide repeat protein [Holosporaceae bacterium 'Namur']
MLASENIQRSGSSSSSSSGSNNFWEIEGITINLDHISINQEEFDTELRRIKTNGVGGLGIEQTAGALKMRLKDRGDVYVVYDKEICGVAEFDNIRIANQINRLVLAQKYVVFPYAINEEHQVSVVINMEEKKLVITDSLGINRTNNNNIKDLARKLKVERIIDGTSNYNIQRNNWECGVHTFFNTMDILNNQTSISKTNLELDNNLKTVLEYSFKYKWIEEKLQLRREENRAEKTRLLEAIESLRDSEGHFRNSNPEDDLKILADVLQMEIWGNLDRSEPTSSPGRSLTQEEMIRERKIEELIAQYEKNYHEDVLGIIILNVLKRGGQYNEVIKYHRSVLESESRGYDDSKKLRTQASKLNNLGLIFLNLGKYKQSLDCFNQALTYHTNTNEHPEVAIIYHNIGTVLGEQYQYDEALKYHRKSLAIREKIYGKEHLEIASSYNAIGTIAEQHDEIYDKALSYYAKALIIREKFLGKDHHETATIYSNIGCVLGGKSEYDQALNYHKRALAIRKNTFGKEHSEIANSYRNIGLEFKGKCNHNQALIYFRKALSINQKIYGEEHPDVEELYDYIGSVLYDQNHYDEALIHYEKALLINQKIFGNINPFIVLLYNSIGMSLYRQNQYDEALKNFYIAISITEKIYTKEHPDIALLFNNIGMALYMKGINNNEVLDYHKKALNIRKKVFGENHPDVKISYNKIVMVLHAQNRHEEALEYENKVNTITESNNNLDNIRVIEEQEAREEVAATKTIQKSNSNNSLTHTELMKKFQKELRVSWGEVYIGIAVEQALVGMAGINTIQTGAQYRTSATNGVNTTRFQLRFENRQELRECINFYNREFPGLLINESLEFQAGSFTTINMDTRILHNNVAKELGEHAARERGQATSSIRATNSRSEQSGCYLS